MSVTKALPREQAVARILEVTRPGQPATTRPWLVLTAGLPGSGKSTFARQLAAATGATVLESDALRPALFASPTHDKAESRTLFDALYAACRRLLQQGQHVIVDATNLREQDRQQAYATAEAANAGILVFYLYAPEQVIATRLASRAQRVNGDDRSTAGPDVYARLAETEQPIRRDHRRVDTSDAAATEAAVLHAIETLRPPQGTPGRSTREGSIS